MLKGVYLVFIASYFSLQFAKNYLLYTHFDFYNFRLENKGTILVYKLFGFFCQAVPSNK